MTPFSPEVSQALVDVELAVVASLLRSMPLSALVLLGAVVFAVSWMCWVEGRAWPTGHRHA